VQQTSAFIRPHSRAHVHVTTKKTGHTQDTDERDRADRQSATTVVYSERSLLSTNDQQPTAGYAYLTTRNCPQTVLSAAPMRIKDNITHVAFPSLGLSIVAAARRPSTPIRLSPQNSRAKQTMHTYAYFHASPIRRMKPVVQAHAEDKKDRRHAALGSESTTSVTSALHWTVPPRLTSMPLSVTQTS